MPAQETDTNILSKHFILSTLKINTVNQYLLNTDCFPEIVVQQDGEARRRETAKGKLKLIRPRLVGKT